MGTIRSGDSMNRHWKGATLVLVAGFVAGSLFGVYVLRPRPAGLPDEARTERILKKFSRKLDLSPEQKESIAAILQTKHVRMKALREETRPHFDGVRQTARGEIRALLTSGQQEKFDRMVLKWEERRRKTGRWDANP